MIREVLGALAFVIAFNAIAVGVLLFVLPPWYGLVWALALGAAFLWWQLRKGPHWRARHALIRIRPPRASFTRIALAGTATLMVLFGIAGMIEIFGRPLRPEDLRGWELLGKYQESLPGWLALTALLALVIPVVEEFYFRGRIQHSLERKYGLLLAVAVTSLLFAVSHIGVPRSAILLIPLTLGVANGIAAHLFRSIWVPVGIHALWNGSLALLGRFNAENGSTYGAMDHGAILALSCILIVLGGSGWFIILRFARRLRPTPVQA
jgi:hypothetical protein